MCEQCNAQRDAARAALYSAIASSPNEAVATLGKLLGIFDEDISNPARTEALNERLALAVSGVPLRTLCIASELAAALIVNAGNTHEEIARTILDAGIATGEPYAVAYARNEQWVFPIDRPPQDDLRQRAAALLLLDRLHELTAEKRSRAAAAQEN